MHHVNTRGEWPFERPSNYVRINFLICDLEFSFFRFLVSKFRKSAAVVCKADVELAGIYEISWEQVGVAVSKRYFPIHSSHALVKCAATGL